MGEDDSDAESIAILVRRLRDAVGLPPVKIRRRGFGGCAQLLKKGAAQLSAWYTSGCTRAYVCYDSDRDEPGRRRERVIREVIEPSGAPIACCAIVPIQELEAWFHADIEKLALLFNWCRSLNQVASPESINDPKKRLREISRHPLRNKYLYQPAAHNPYLAGEIDLDVVARRCPSFRELANFVRSEQLPAQAPTPPGASL